MRISYLLLIKFRLNDYDIEELFDFRLAASKRFNELLDNREEQIIDYMDLTKIIEVEGKESLTEELMSYRRNY